MGPGVGGRTASIAGAIALEAARLVRAQSRPPVRTALEADEPAQGAGGLDIADARAVVPAGWDAVA